MIIRRPWLSALFLSIAVVGSVAESLLTDTLTPTVRLILSSVVATTWGVFGAAAFEYLKARRDLRQDVEAALLALSNRSNEGLLLAVKALEAQKVSGFFDNAAVVAFVRVLVLLRDSCALIRMQRWLDAHRLLGNNPFTIERAIQSLEPVPEEERELMRRVLLQNLEASAFYAGQASVYPRFDAWISELEARVDGDNWQLALSALDELAEATAKFLGSPTGVGPTARARAYSAEATLLKVANGMAQAKTSVLVGVDIQSAGAVVDDHLRRKLGLLRTDLHRAIQNTLAFCVDGRYAKCLVVNNIHSASYLLDVAAHPAGPEKLYACEEDLLTAAAAFPVGLRTIRYNICVCLWRAGEGYSMRFDRYMKLLLAEAALPTDQLLLFSTLRDFAAGHADRGMEGLFALISQHELGIGKLVRKELDKFARLLGDGSSVALDLSKFKAAGQRPRAWADESAVLLGIFLPAYADASYRYPVFCPTPFGEEEV